MTMADLLAAQDPKKLQLNRGQEVNGTVIAKTDSELILDLGTKAEGVLSIKDLPLDQQDTLNVGDSVTAYVIIPENESGQAVLTVQRGNSRGVLTGKWLKFQDSKDKGTVYTGKGIEVNKGGLIVEVNGTRGFLPSSQISLTQVADIDELIGKDLEVSIIEVDANQNRLIFSQKTRVDEATKQKIAELKSGESVTGKIIAILPFGLLVSFNDGIEGLVHSAEISWEKTENATADFKVGDEVTAKITNTEPEAGRVSLSLKQLTQDPFAKLVEEFQPDDVVKGEVNTINTQGVTVSLSDGVEGFVPANKLDPSITYEVNQSTNFLVDNVDTAKRRVNLAPFLTSTEGLIYK